MKELLRRMNLQLFADGVEPTNQAPEPAPTLDEPAPSNGGEPKPDSKPFDMEEIRKLIQSETDKVRTEYSRKLKEAQAELERLKAEKMTEEEKAKYEQEKLQKELQEKEQALLQRELNLLAVELLNESDMPIEFKEFVIGSDQETTKARIATLKSLWTKSLEKAVQERFKENGRIPHDSGGDGNTVKNPWSKEHFNLTEQGRLLRENPELAKQLMAAAGKK